MENIEKLAIESGCESLVHAALCGRKKRCFKSSGSVQSSAAVELVPKLLVIGGGTNLIEYYCPLFNIWKKLGELPENAKYNCCYVFESILYLFIGKQSSEITVRILSHLKSIINIKASILGERN